MRPKYDLDGVTQGKRHSKAYKKSSVPGPGKYNQLNNNSTSGPKCKENYHIFIIE